MNVPSRRIAVNLGGEWFETDKHREENGRLYFILHDGTVADVGPGQWKPLEQAKKQFEVKIKKRR